VRVVSQVYNYPSHKTFDHQMVEREYDTDMCAMMNSDGKKRVESDRQHFDRVNVQIAMYQGYMRAAVSLLQVRDHRRKGHRRLDGSVRG
jgi:hypothetical protein